MAPQGLWPDILGRAWPPETTLDGQPWTILRATPRELVMVSGRSDAHAARLQRTISLPDDSATVRIDHRIERLSDDPNPVQVWTVTQVHLPRTAWLDLSEELPGPPKVIAGSKDRLGLAVRGEIAALRFDWPREEPSKVGTFGQWVAAVYDKTVFVQYAPLLTEANYYDEANCEIYVDPKQRYMELELLSPTTYLSKDQTLEFSVTWKLLERASEESEEQLINRIRRQDLEE